MKDSPKTQASPTKTPARRGYGGRSAAELAEERRQRLLAAALELFGTQGYQATPVDRICAEAKVTTRHFYESFADREALLIAIFEQVMNDTKAKVLATLMSPTLQAEDRLPAAIEAFLDAQLGDPRRARLTTREMLGVSPRAEASRNSVINGFAELIEIYTGVLVQNGDFPPRNYRVLAYGIVGAMHELQIAWLSNPGALSRQSLSEELMFLIKTLVAGARLGARGV